MKSFFHLWRRELADQRYFFLAALIAGTLPYLLAELASADRKEIADLRTAIARAVVAGFFVIVPILLGGRWLVAGFADRRRAFELARPLSAWQLCGSKLAAILTIVLGGSLLASLPSLTTAFLFDLAPLDAWIYRLLAGDPLAPWNSYRVLISTIGPAGINWPFFGILLTLVVFIPLAILTLMQCLSLVFAERSWRSLVDLAAWLVFIGLLAAAAERLRSFAALTIAMSWLPPLGFSICILGAISAWRSFQAGSLIEHAHGRHSLSMNVGLLALGSLTAISAYAATRPDIEKLSSFLFAFPSDDGSHWMIAGSQDPRGFNPAFLVDTVTAKATYLDGFDRLAGYPRFSADGRRLFLVRFEKGHPWESLYFEDGVRSSKPGQVVRGFGYLADLDSDGRLLVTLDHPAQLGVYEVPEGRRRAQIPIPMDQGSAQVVHRQGTRFDLLVNRRGTDGGETEIRRFHFDAASLKLEAKETWHLSSEAKRNAYELETWWSEALPLLDAGVPFEKLAGSPRLTALAGGFGVLVDVTARKAPHAGFRFKIVDPRGEEVGSIDAPPSADPAGEIRPGLLLVGLHRKADSFEYLIRAYDGRMLPASSAPLETLVVEVPSGKILRKLEGFTPRKFAAANNRVWLENAYGEPFDLEAADAEPRRILPFRPRLATQ